MKGIILFLVIAVGLSANPRELHYKVEQINSNTVEVTLDFTPKKGGETLYVPDSAELLSHKKSGKSLKVENSDHQVKYLVKAKGKWKCSGGYIPRIEKDFFHLEGENLFVRPVGRDSEELKMHIQWDENREIASSFGTGINPQDFTASILDLKRSIFLGGKNLNIEKLEIDSANLYFVSHIKKGDISKDKQTILKIMKEQRKMYGARDFNDYMVAILDDTDRGGGRAFVNACCVYMPAKKTPEDMPWIFSHEHFHTFNGIGTHGQYAKEDLTWFIEGFTEFYANRTNVRAGIYDETTYEKNIKRTIKEYNNSKAKNFSYNQVLKSSNELSFCKRYLYVKGHLFAHFLDQRIQAQSNSSMCLDHFMKEIYTTYYPNANALTFAKLAKVYANFDETSLEEHFNKFMYSEQLMISEQEILT